MDLSTREIALLIWGAVFLSWAFTVPGVRGSLFGLFRSALHWKLVTPVAIVILYLMAAVWGLYLIQFWTPELFKDTIVWGLFSGIAMAFSAVCMDAKAPTWRRVLADQAKAVVLIEYVLNTYTFTLWVELLLVPALTFLAMLDTIARLDERHQPVAKLTGFLLAVTGFTILWFAIRSALSEVEAFSMLGVMRDLLLPPLLSLALLPMVYVFFLMSAYEQLFLVLRIGPVKNRSVVRYAKLRLFQGLGLRPNIVRSFLLRERVALISATTTTDIDELLNRVTDIYQHCHL